MDVQGIWKNVGLGLGLDDKALGAIEVNYRGNTNSCMMEVFTQWHDADTSVYCWRKLAEVLCLRAVNKQGLLPAMLDRINKLSRCN